MATSHVRLPDDPELRRAHLLGLNSATQGLDDADVEARRPALEPYRTEFDHGRAVGLHIAEANHARRKALQENRSGLEHRIVSQREEKEAKKLPPLP